MERSEKGGGGQHPSANFFPKSTTFYCRFQSILCHLKLKKKCVNPVLSNAIHTWGFIQIMSIKIKSLKMHTHLVMYSFLFLRKNCISLSLVKRLQPATLHLIRRGGGRAERRDEKVRGDINRWYAG